MKRSILSALFALLVGFMAQAQTIRVHGTVISGSDNEPLIGASVVSDVKTTNGAATDLDGEFTLHVPEG
ncbi:MAG: carboxypeptidase-like regulatory domain-containing protein, partial [Duncaniella sp.]|nr:carboxypeptidase-like regulatory domain-containing protein [Duncaniella sp.]